MFPVKQRLGVGVYDIFIIYVIVTTTTIGEYQHM